MDRIKFQNYKAFDEGELEIRPLTLLLGANSSGKSSILHLFLMLEQTISNADKYNAALKTNGHCITLGEDENLLKDKMHDKPLILEFGINPLEYINSIKVLQEEKQSEISYSYLFSLKANNPEKYGQYSKSILEKLKTKGKSWPVDFSEVFNDYFSISKPKKFDILYNYFAHGVFPIRGNDMFWTNNIDLESQEKFLYSIFSCFASFKNAFNPYPEKASIKFALSYNDSSRKLKVTECHVIVGEKTVVKIISQGKECLLYSEIFKKDDLDVLAQHSSLHFEFDGLSIRSLSESNNPFVDYVQALIGQAFKSVQDFFYQKNMNYVGPLRANPQRYYFLDDSNTNTTLVHSSGTSLAEILKKNKPVRDKINKWLDRFDLNVDVQEFKDVIHNIKVTQNKLLLDIPDVGFGISQVLPILVEGMMAPSRSTIIMEQPEIHLHPKMQAELADLFIDILQLQTKRKDRINKHLIIETHSEYILKRIRRRMAEGQISPKHVAIYFVKPRNRYNPDTAEIQLAPISKDGTIEWPREFYETEMEDELAFFKSKIAKS